MAKSKYTKISISPTEGSKQNSWESFITNNNGVLAGYAEDLSKSDINKVLLSILKIKIKDEEGESDYVNWTESRFHYAYIISSLQYEKEYNDEDGKEELNKELELFQQESPSAKAIEVMLKYGVNLPMTFFIPTSKVCNKIYKDVMANDQAIQKVEKQPSVLSTGNNSKVDDESSENNSNNEESLKAIETEKDFESYSSQSLNIKDLKRGGSFKYNNPHLEAQVVIYSKVKFRAYDITNFISSINTSVTRESGGNFDIKMHLVSQEELQNGTRYQNNNLNITGYTKSLFLQSIFRENDIVYIRFENLKSEKKEKTDSSGNPIIKGKDWTMMGLIDSTTIVSDYSSLSLNIHGRDFIKLLIEDNNLFIPYHYGNTPDDMFGGGDSKIYKRLFASGEYNTMFTKTHNTIKNFLNFIVSQLTTIQILSDSTLSFLDQEYGQDNLNTKIEISYPGVEKEELDVEGIWKLIQVIVAPSIQNYLLADASLKDPSGSILQQILKVCQRPFVEFIADTYIDKYILFARRPPISITDICNQTFIPIGREVVLNDSLEFDKEVYSVYSLMPQGGCYADNNSIALAYLPWIVLDDYVKMWGNRLYSQTYNYLTIDAYSKATEENKKSIKENFIDDLLWLIESTAYLPFSRKGTITIVGDRRIKVGQWIYYEKSNEVFYVDGVSNYAAIQGDSVVRTTTLTVSRGLVKNYIIKPKEKGQTNISEVSYGDLVDLSTLKEGLTELTVKMNKNFELHRDTKVGEGPKDYVAQKSVVIPEVFNFFLSGKQFEGVQNPYTLYYNMAALTLKEIGGGSGSKGNGNQGQSGKKGFSKVEMSMSESDGNINTKTSMEQAKNQQKVFSENNKSLKKVKNPTITRNKELGVMTIKY